MFEITYKPRYGDFKDFNTLKPGSVFDMVQDASISHSAMLGYTIGKLFNMNIAWLMQGIKAEFLYPLDTSSPVKIQTDVCSMKGASSERGCLITQNGVVRAKTVANWFTFDILKQKPCRIPEEIQKAYPVYNFEDDFFSYKKPKILSSDTFNYTIQVRNKDLDTNHHLNNQKSIDMLLDALPFDFNIRLMSVFYKTPAYLGDKLRVFKKELDDGYYVHLQNEKDEICVAGNFIV